MHFTKITDLKPRTIYYYQVKSAASDWSDVSSFKSLYYGLSDGGETRVAIFGDMGVYTYNNMGNLVFLSALLIIFVIFIVCDTYDFYEKI